MIIVIPDEGFWQNWRNEAVCTDGKRPNGMHVLKYNLAMARASGILLIILGGAIFAWTFLPARTVAHTLAVAPAQMAETQAAIQGQPQAILLPYQATLFSPEWLLPGQTAAIRLVFAPALASAPGPETTITVDFADIYTGHTVQVEARLDLPGAGLQSGDRQILSLPPGQSAVFEWQIYPAQAGGLQGAAWLWLHYYPVDGGTDSDVLVSAQPIKVSVPNIPAPGIRLAATAAFVAGLGITFASRRRR